MHETQTAHVLHEELTRRAVSFRRANRADPTSNLPHRSRSEEFHGDVYGVENYQRCLEIFVEVLRTQNARVQLKHPRMFIADTPDDVIAVTVDILDGGIKLTTSTASFSMLPNQHEDEDAQFDEHARAMVSLADFIEQLPPPPMYSMVLEDVRARGTQVIALGGLATAGPRVMLSGAEPLHFLVPRSAGVVDDVIDTLVSDRARIIPRNYAPVSIRSEIPVVCDVNSPIPDWQGSEHLPDVAELTRRLSRLDVATNSGYVRIDMADKQVFAAVASRSQTRDDMVIAPREVAAVLRNAAFPEMAIAELGRRLV